MIRDNRESFIFYLVTSNIIRVDQKILNIIFYLVTFNMIRDKKESFIVYLVTSNIIRIKPEDS